MLCHSSNASEIHRIALITDNDCYTALQVKIKHFNPVLNISNQLFSFHLSVSLFFMFLFCIWFYIIYNILSLLLWSSLTTELYFSWMNMLDQFLMLCQKMQYMSHSFVLSFELKHVNLADRKQLLEGDLSMTSGSQLWHKYWPILKQHGQRVTLCLGHNHRKMSRAKRDTYPNIPQLPFHPLGALQFDFTLKVKAVWYNQVKPTSGVLHYWIDMSS